MSHEDGISHMSKTKLESLARLYPSVHVAIKLNYMKSIVYISLTILLMALQVNTVSASIKSISVSYCTSTFPVFFLDVGDAKVGEEETISLSIGVESGGYLNVDSVFVYAVDDWSDSLVFPSAQLITATSVSDSIVRLNYSSNQKAFLITFKLDPFVYTTYKFSLRSAAVSGSDFMRGASAVSSIGVTKCRQPVGSGTGPYSHSISNIAEVEVVESQVEAVRIDNEQPRFIFSPQPASTVLYIEPSVEDDFEVKIYTINGELVSSAVLKGFTELPIDDIAPGIYNISFIYDGKPSVQYFIKY